MAFSVVMRVRIANARFLAGEVGALLSGELSFKLIKVVSSPTWSAEKEFFWANGGGINFPQRAADSLALDSLLLIGGWFAASILTYGCLGYIPAKSGERWDASLSMLVSAGNIILFSVLISATLKQSSLAIYDYEALTAMSLGAVLIFRTLYRN